MSYEDGYEKIEISDEDMSSIQRMIIEGFVRDGEFKARAALIELLQEDVAKHLQEAGDDPNLDWVDGVRYAIHTVREADLYGED